MPVYPFTYDHRRTVIDANDQHLTNALADVNGVTESHVDQPVTVADLLDALYASPFNGDNWGDLWADADAETRESLHRIQRALVAHEQLSPEDRTEFDRRTT